MAAQEIRAALKARPQVVRRLRKVREFILKHPQHFKMSEWWSLKGEGRYGSQTCGTTACIAGWYALTQRRVWKPMARGVAALTHTKTGVTKDIRQLFAEDVLGSDTIFDLAHLTNHYRWPEPFKSEFAAVAPEMREFTGGGDARKAARVAARRITHFLRTGE